MYMLKTIFFLMIFAFPYSVNAQQNKNKPRTVKERSKMEAKAYRQKMKSGNDSIYIQFIHCPYDPDSNTVFAANGWYRSPMAERKNFVLDNHMLIIPAQQNVKRELKITAFLHEMKKPEDFTYPWVFRNDQVKLPEKAEPLVAGVIDGYYFRDTVLRNFEKEKKHVLDSISKLQETYRKEKIQPWVTELLQPFYFSQTEITNYQYRQFVHWVRDSIAIRKIYFGLDKDDEAAKWLNTTEKKAYLDSDRQENLQRYGLNYNLKIDYTDEKIVPLVESMYFPQPERFYVRREMDSRKFIYVKSNGDTLAIYPDTLSFVREGAIYDDPYTNMYFWHPAYDNYPVLGLNYEQAIAYCEWYQREMNEKMKKEGYQVEVGIPSLYEYEMAMKYNLPKSGKNQIENQSNEAYYFYEKPSSMDEHACLNPVRSSFQYVDPDRSQADRYEAIWKYNNWLQANISSPIYFLNGNVSEFCSTPVSPAMIAHYKLSVPSGTDLKQQRLLIGSSFKKDVIDLKGNQKNALFYKQLVPKTQTGVTHGFRTVIYLKKIK